MRKRDLGRLLPPYFKDICGLLIIVATVASARASLADHYTVPTGSMRPAVEVGDRVLVDKRAFGLRVPGTETYLFSHASPERGDVVVLNSPHDGRVLLKRVVAVPGDQVEVRGGRVSIDGRARAEPLRLADGGGPDFGPTIVPQDRFLVLGDNRGDSFDGRFFGFVERSAILGRAERVYARNGAITWLDL